MIRRLFIFGVVAALLAITVAPLFAQTTKPVDLDAVFVPREGAMPPAPIAADYKLVKGKGLRSCTWFATSQPVAPVVRWAGERDYPAMYSGVDDKPTIGDVVFDCGRWGYALTSNGSIDARRVCVRGGGGLFRTVGARGVNRLTDCRQLEASDNYVFYIGPLTTHKTNPLIKVNSGGKLKPKSLSYTERNTGTVELLRCDALFGSRWMACGRFVGFDTLKILDCHWSDTEAQSAPGAVANAVLRIHHGGDAVVEDSSFTGHVFLGPLNGNDGGLLTNGAERAFRERERLRSLTFRRCTFDSDSFKIAPGILRASFEDCTIRAKGSTVITVEPFPYLTRPASVVTFTNVKFFATGANPKVLGGPGLSTGGAARIKIGAGCTLNGKKI